VKTIALCLCFVAGIGSAVPAFSNIAMPQRAPSPAGDILAPLPGLDSLRIDRENLRLDLTGDPSGRSLAHYEISNPSGISAASDLYFVTPFMDDVYVTVDGRRADFDRVMLSRDRLPWPVRENDYAWWPKDGEMDAARFRAEFSAGETTVIEVSFRLPAGYDNALAGTGISPAAVAHALNWSKPGDRVAWYVYALETSRTFKGGFGTLHLEITVPAGTELICNAAIGEKKSGRGFDTYTMESKGLPVPAIDAKVITRGVYNFLGGTVGCGLATDFNASTSFLGQALIDVFFLNHQFSTGIEGNPFGTIGGLKIPLIYTFVFGTTRSLYSAFFADVRLSAGVLIDLLPETAVGFRVSAGMRLMMFLMEISYDFHPFDAARGYTGRLTFLGKISL